MFTFGNDNLSTEKFDLYIVPDAGKGNLNMCHKCDSILAPSRMQKHLGAGCKNISELDAKFFTFLNLILLHQQWRAFDVRIPGTPPWSEFISCKNATMGSGFQFIFKQLKVFSRLLYQDFVSIASRLLGKVMKG